MCACGRPLHYADPFLRKLVQEWVDELGESMPVHVGGRAWMIPRHYIALHGLKAAEIEKLGFPEVTDAARS